MICAVYSAVLYGKQKGKLMNIQKLPVAKLKAAKYNPRRDLRPGDPEYEKLKRSITEFGYVEPVIWNKATGNVVGGHGKSRASSKPPKET